MDLLFVLLGDGGSILAVPILVYALDLRIRKKKPS